MPGHIAGTQDRSSLATVMELAASYIKHCHAHYRKIGKVTAEYGMICRAVTFRTLHGCKDVIDIRPSNLREAMAAWQIEGCSRQTINKYAGRIRRMFKWAVTEDIVPADVHAALERQGDLHKGRTEAREAPAVAPIELAMPFCRKRRVTAISH